MLISLFAPFVLRGAGYFARLQPNGRHKISRSALGSSDGRAWRPRSLFQIERFLPRWQRNIWRKKFSGTKIVAKKSAFATPTKSRRPPSGKVMGSKHASTSASGESFPPRKHSSNYGRGHSTFQDSPGHSRAASPLPSPPASSPPTAPSSDCPGDSSRLWNSLSRAARRKFTNKWRRRQFLKVSPPYSDSLSLSLITMVFGCSSCLTLFLFSIFASQGDQFDLECGSRSEMDLEESGRGMGLRPSSTYRRYGNGVLP